MLRPRRRPTIALTLAVTCSLILGAGLGGFSAAPAEAQNQTGGSALTVRWANDQGPAKDFQPQRDEASVHYADLKNVEVKVAQTTNLIDQTIRVDVTGMPGPTATVQEGGSPKNTGYNFVQAMQCWGDPSSDDFYKNCQWGGHTLDSVAGNDFAFPGVTDRAFSDVNLPFRAVWGEEFPSDVTSKGIRYGNRVNELFSAANTNEVLAARVKTDGTAWFNFEAQTSYAAPHLGCGLVDEKKGAGERCWLVIVPRGEHATKVSTCQKADMVGSREGRKRVQAGSPVDQRCEWWSNRMVIPLDFQPTGTTCSVGAAERSIAGSELISNAISSWKPTLCTAKGGATFNYSSLSDSVARDQLLTGQSRFVFTGRPLTKETVSADLADSVADASIVYAPTAITAPVVAFFARHNREGRLEQDIKLTPRLIAKLLTQSYAGTVPIASGLVDRPDYNHEWITLVYDPEFQSINPEWAQFAVDLTYSTQPGLIVVPGASDANSQLWQWIQADDKARAFLAGESDNVRPEDKGNKGLKVNPHYLPKGHPGATTIGLRKEGRDLIMDPAAPRRHVGLTREDGTPYSLTDTVLDTLPRADEWSSPLVMLDRKARLDTTQWNPGRNTYNDVALDVLRENRRMKTEWDPKAMNAAGEYGDWAMQPVGRYFSSIMMGLTTTPSADAYGLNVAKLQLPNQPSVFVGAEDPEMLGSLAAQVPGGVEGVTVTDPAQARSGQYPLTQIVWGAMRLDGSTAEERNDYANFLEYATTKGQVQGPSSGQLPVGYAPLTPMLKAQAAAAVATIRAYVPPAEGGNDGPGDGTDDDGTTPDGGMNPNTTPPNGLGGNTPGGSIDNDTLTPANQPTAQLGNTPEEASGTHTAAPVGVFSVLGGTLLLGLSGAAASPALLRRRDTAPL